MKMLVIRVSVMGGQALGEALLRLEVGGAVHRLLDVPHEVPQCEVVAEAHHRPLLARLVSRLPLVVREDVEVRERRQKHLDANQKICPATRQSKHAHPWENINTNIRNKSKQTRANGGKRGQTGEGLTLRGGRRLVIDNTELSDKSGDEG